MTRRVELRTLWREIADAEPAGLDPDWLRVVISADGRSDVCTRSSPSRVWPDRDAVDLRKVRT